MSVYRIGWLLPLKRLSSQHASAGRLSQSEMKVTVYDLMGSDENALLVTSMLDVNDSHNFPAPLLAWHGQGEKVGSAHGGHSWWQQAAGPPHHHAMHNPGTLTHPKSLISLELGGKYPVQVGLNHIVPAILTVAGVHSLTFCKAGHVDATLEGICTILHAYLLQIINWKISFYLSTSAWNH